MTSDKAPNPSLNASSESGPDASPESPAHAAAASERATTAPDHDAAAGQGMRESPGDGTSAPTPGPAPAQGQADKVFQALRGVAPLVLLLVLAAQAWPDFWQAWRGDALYCPAESQHIRAFLHTAQHGPWLAPSAGLTPEADGMGCLAAQWPGFTWFMALLSLLLPQAASALLFPLAGALAAALALLGVWGLSRAAGFGPRAALASGLILLCSPLFAPLVHFTGSTALSAALLLFSLLCFCRGWQARRAWFLLPTGFVLAGMAGLTGGLFHLLLPLLASAVFLLWRGAFRRAQGADALSGFALLLLLLGAWLGGVILWTHAEGYMQELYATLARRPWPLPDRWWWPLAGAALGLAPWLALVLCVAWRRVLLSAWGDLKASRAERAGSAFVWITLVLGCLLSLLTPVARMQGVAVALACLAAPLLGKALLRLPHLGSRLFYLIAALCLLHAGLALMAAGFGFSLDWMARFFSHPLTPEQREMILGLRALPVLGALCLLAAVAMTRFIRRDHPGGALLFCALTAVILTQPASLMLAPELAALPQAGLNRLQDIQSPTAPVNGGDNVTPAAPAAEAPPEIPNAPRAVPLPLSEETPAREPAGAGNAPLPPQEVTPVAPQEGDAPPQPQPETRNDAVPHVDTDAAPAAPPAPAGG
ncbi:glycosyltransferase family 39 protein [Desulfovibrio sp. SGI.169]|uniref:glycosyltransferase family 39 protein n=1 Tax=Desulfovibrio sp. SGI.169 TaxID=3420561 RepID=UPI003D04F024